jgi:hypothetical protein
MIDHETIHHVPAETAEVLDRMKDAGFTKLMNVLQREDVYTKKGRVIVSRISAAMKMNDMETRRMLDDARGHLKNLTN